MTSSNLNEILQAGERARQTGQWLDAEQLFRQALTLNAKNLAALNALGELYEKSSDPGRAEEFFQSAIRHGSRDPQGYVNLSRLLNQYKRYDEGAER